MTHTYLSLSIKPACLVRTQDNIMISRSPPWNASTVDIIIDFCADVILYVDYVISIAWYRIRTNIGEELNWANFHYTAKFKSH